MVLDTQNEKVIRKREKKRQLKKIFNEELSTDH